MEAMNMNMYADGKWHAMPCPAPSHAGDRDSESLNVRYDGRSWTLKCHSHDCPYDEIADALGVGRRSGDFDRHLAASYSHPDGVPRRVYRMDFPADARGAVSCPYGRCRRTTPHKHIWGNGSMEGTRILLWGEDHSENALLVVEGEKTASALVAAGANKMGFTPVSSRGGAKAAMKSDWGAADGRDVVFWADADSAGEEYANEAAVMSSRAGAKSLREVANDDMKDGEDAADLDAETIRSMLDRQHPTKLAPVPREDAPAVPINHPALEIFGGVGQEGINDATWAVWAMVASPKHAVAAYEYNPPVESDGAQNAVLFRRDRHGILDRRDGAVGSLLHYGADAYAIATSRAELHPREASAVFKHVREMRNGTTPRRVRAALAGVVQRMEHERVKPPAPCVDLALVDADPRYLGAANGIIDLWTGEIVDATATGALVSRRTPVAFDPDARHPAVDALIAHPTSPEAVDFVLNAVAHALLGTPRITKRFYVMYDDNDGNSGKTAIWDAVKSALGELAKEMRRDALERSSGDAGRANPEMAVLTECRVAYSAEFQETRISADSLKMVMGEGRVVFRLMRENWQTRPITATVLVSSNGVPALPFWDNPTVERYVPIPFLPIPKHLRDPKLATTFATDPDAQRAMLAELIRRVVRNQEPPPIPQWSLDARESHREAGLGSLTLFIRDRIERGGEDDKVSGEDVWQAWIEANDGELPDNSGRVGGETRANVSRRVKMEYNVPSKPIWNGTRSVRGWRGLRLIDAEEKPTTVEMPISPETEEDALECVFVGCGNAATEAGGDCGQHDQDEINW